MSAEERLARFDEDTRRLKDRAAAAAARCAARVKARAGLRRQRGLGSFVALPCAKSSAARQLRNGSGARPRQEHTEPSSSGTLRLRPNPAKAGVAAAAKAVRAMPLAAVLAAALALAGARP